MNTYEVAHDGVAYLIESDDEAGGFVASIPDLPGCFSQGETLDDTLTGIHEAMLLHVECLADAGDSVPLAFQRFIPARAT